MKCRSTFQKCQMTFKILIRCFESGHASRIPWGQMTHVIILGGPGSDHYRCHICFPLCEKLGTSLGVINSQTLIERGSR